MTINRPKQMNALNTGIVEQIDKLLDEVEADPSIRCLIITGAGEKSLYRRCRYRTDGERRAISRPMPII